MNQINLYNNSLKAQNNPCIFIKSNLVKSFNHRLIAASLCYSTKFFIFWKVRLHLGQLLHDVISDINRIFIHFLKAKARYPIVHI